MDELASMNKQLHWHGRTVAARTLIAVIGPEHGTFDDGTLTGIMQRHVPDDPNKEGKVMCMAAHEPEVEWQSCPEVKVCRTAIAVWGGSV